MSMHIKVVKSQHLGQSATIIVELPNKHPAQLPYLDESKKEPYEARCQSILLEEEVVMKKVD